MTPNIFDETKLSVSELARRENVSPSTVWRWTQRGCDGHRLETYQRGGRRFTSDEAFDRWLCRINHKDSGPCDRTERQRKAMINNAEQFLDAEGA